MSGGMNSDFRTVRGYQLVNLRDGQLTSALEDYLEMTYRLCAVSDYTRVGKLSELLNVKPSSTSKMIFKLADLGYLNYDRYGIIRLTERGKKLGEYLLYRHETLQNFLNLIGSQNALEETELIEHSLCAATVSRLQDLIDFFGQNPASKASFEDYKKAKRLR